MKLIFSGPSLHGSDVVVPEDIRVLGPAAQGDLLRATEDGATVIGLIDGRYEDVAAVWHKEILDALSRGVTVLGAASIGALRAAECAPFGMIGIGAIFEGYRDGTLEDDSDVAIVHGPPELAYVPLSEPLVNIRATLGALLSQGHITTLEHQRLDECAARTFFKDRTWRAVLQASAFDPCRESAMRELIRSFAVNQKRLDAEALVLAVGNLPDRYQTAPSHWTLQKPRFVP